MARVSWKYIYTTKEDIKHFYLKFIGNYKILESYRNKTINNLNKNCEYYIHQGKNYVYLDSNKYCISKKLGMFSKTRKPFFFRTKIKKNKKK